MRHLLYLCLLTFAPMVSNAQEVMSVHVKDSLNNRYYTNGVAKYHSYSAKFQFYADTFLHFFPNNPEIWQQRAIPLFKTGKYEIGIKYLNKAVELDKKEYIAYRGFINCIFLKQHSQSIQDFKEATVLKGEGYEIDHPYAFYIGLNYLQINQLDSAKYYLERSMEIERRSKSEHFLSPTNWFYLGIVAYEQERWQDALINFDKTLSLYSSFPEAKYYKALILRKLEQKELAKSTLKEAVADYHTDYLFPEYNAVYEHYPYEVKKRVMQSWLEYFEKE